MPNLSLFESLTRKRAVFLFLLGFVLRIIGSFGYGDGDVEHFKAWTVLISESGLVGMYSEPDSILMRNSIDTDTSILASFIANRRKISFNPSLDYWRSEYVVMYPPVSEVFLFISGRLQRQIVGNLENSRWSNFFVNLPMVVFACLIFGLLFKLSNYGSNGEFFSVIPFFYWLNPIFILDSPIQGYNNTLIFFLGLLSVLYVKKQRYLLALGIATLILWAKPQGIVILPLIFYVLVLDSDKKILMLAKGSLVVMLVSCLILLVPLLNGYFWSYLFGSASAVFFLDSWSTILITARTWNFWYIFGFFFSDLREMNIELKVLSEALGINIKLVSYILFGLVNIFFLGAIYHLKLNSKGNILDRLMLLLMGVFLSYNTFMVNVQFNQFILIVPGLVYFMFRYQDMRSLSMVLMLFYFSQIFYYGGLGRDFGTPVGLVYYLDIVPFVNFFILAATILSMYIWILYFRRLIRLFY